MSDQLPMFDLTTCEGTASAISSPASGSGATHLGSQDGPTSARSGPDRAPASPSARLGSKKESQTSDTFGPNGSGSSRVVGLPSYSESKSPQAELLAGLSQRLRTCKGCGIEQPSSQFYRNSKGHLRSRCKTCCQDHSSATKKANPEKTKASFSAWRMKNRGAALTRLAQYRASAKGMPFKLDPTDIQGRIDLGACEVTGIAFDLTKPRAWNAPSLDQITPGAGYTTENVRVVLYALNVMANTWGHRPILEIAKAINGRRAARSNDFSRRLAEKLKETTDQLGSTLFAMTWKEHIMPSGRTIWRLRASEPHIEGSVCIGWGTPTVQDARHASLSASEMERDPKVLHNEVHLAGWPTTRAEDAESSGMRHSRGVADTMTAVASLAGWATPKQRDYRGENEASLMREGHPLDLNKMVLLAGWKTPVPNGGRISGNPEDIGQHRDGTKAQIGLENEAKLAGWVTPKKADGDQGSEKMMRGNLTLLGEARLGAWPTPMAQTPAQKGYNEAGNSDSSRKTVEMCQWPVAALSGWGTPRATDAKCGSTYTESCEGVDLAKQATLAQYEAPSTDSGAEPIGFLLGRNGWEIVPACGQLNASHSRWLMGLPAIWDQAAIAAFRLLKARKRGSRGFADTETE